MFETYVTVVGNALHEPQWRKTTNTGALVTTFKIASTARRMDRNTGRWSDGNSLRVRVNCWRALASNVKNSVTSGDPLIVTGRLFTREWTDEHGVKRLQYELEATSVGHDLSRGRAVFERVKQSTLTSEIEDEQAAPRIGGELTEPVPEEEAPAQFDDTQFEEVFDRPVEAPASGYDSGPVGALRDGGFTTEPVAMVAEPDPESGSGSGSGSDLSPVGATVDDPEPAGSLDPAASGEPAAPEPGPGRRRGVRRAKVPA
jgi:single-strand DNA-binding protein